MGATVYIGDEVSASGYVLAGVRVAVPARGGEAVALQRARATTSLVLISAAVAARVPERDLRAAVAALTPLTLVVPDVTGEVAMPDIAHRLRRELGLEA
jgi:vacuolar-type H+-ATPase subunit F/Vma7